MGEQITADYTERNQGISMMVSTDKVVRVGSQRGSLQGRGSRLTWDHC